jgi:predicted nucleotidyltransferase
MAKGKIAETRAGTLAIKDLIHGVIAKHPNIILAYLFGSQVQGDIGPLSDIDVALLLNDADETGMMRSNLRASLTAAIDQERVDVVFLNRAPVELSYAIVVVGELIYERDAYTRVEYEAKTMSLYCDYLSVLRAHRADLLRGGEHETRVQRYREALGRTERTLSALRSAEGQIPR